MFHSIRNAVLGLALATVASVAVLAVPQTAQASHLIQGSKDAKVQILMYGDLQCPYCARFWTYMDQFKADYGDQVGISFVQFPLSFHPQAMPAAINAECAGQQGKFTQFIDAIYKDQSKMGQQRYFEIASNVGITDRAAFVKCVADPETKAAVEADRLTGIAHGVNGTPYVYINGNLLTGVYPYADFKKAIDDVLNK